MKNKLLMIGHIVNFNWILGNWIKEVHRHYPKETSLIWLPSSFARKSSWRYQRLFPLPLYESYFFSYAGTFRSYLKLYPSQFQDKSIVNYTHNMDELGSLSEQSEYLNKAKAVHFNCSRDADMLISHGLMRSKVRVAYAALDSDCSRLPFNRENKTVLLASRFSERKGLSILPSIIEQMPSYKFNILGRGWSKFLKSTRLNSNSRVTYKKFTRQSRNEYMSKSKVFLSLSTLEGGPVPLIESIHLGMIPVATDTGFARDFIGHLSPGILLKINPNVTDVCRAIESANEIEASSVSPVSHLNWHRIADLIMRDAGKI